MSYKIGLILSMFFVVCFLLLGGDMLCLSSAYSSLDSTAITIGYLIAKTGRTDSEFQTYLSETYNINFETILPSQPQQGDVVKFVIYRYYDPLVLSTENIKLSASRTTVVGYYG